MKQGHSQKEVCVGDGRAKAVKEAHGGGPRIDYVSVDFNKFFIQREKKHLN